MPERKRAPISFCPELLSGVGEIAQQTEKKQTNRDVPGNKLLVLLTVAFAAMMALMMIHGHLNNTTTILELFGGLRILLGVSGVLFLICLLPVFQV
jgi:hypothetical protein